MYFRPLPVIIALAEKPTCNVPGELTRMQDPPYQNRLVFPTHQPKEAPEQRTRVRDPDATSPFCKTLYWSTRSTSVKPRSSHLQLSSARKRYQAQTFHVRGSKLDETSHKMAESGVSAGAAAPEKTWTEHEAERIEVDDTNVLSMSFQSFLFSGLNRDPNMLSLVSLI